MKDFVQIRISSTSSSPRRKINDGELTGPPGNKDSAQDGNKLNEITNPGHWVNYQRDGLLNSIKHTAMKVCK